MERFQPKPTRDEATGLAERYGPHNDDEVLAVGRRIVAGEFDRRHLQDIYRWKTRDRGKSRLDRNSDAEIADALRLAVAARTPRSGMAVLLGLYGVNTPVASAIATVIYPETYTIFDYRALEALGCSSSDRSLPFYLDYLEYCTKLARDWRMPLRDLDRALWQWSKECGTNLH